MNKKEKKILSIPEWILNRFNHSTIHEGYSGDFEEEFFNILNTEGMLKAKVWLWIQALKSIPGGISNMLNSNFAMLKSYLKIAFRNIKRHMGYSSINIFGLAIGMTCCLLIFIYVMEEYSYDKYHENGDRIYRITTVSSIGNSTNHYATTPHILAATLGGEIPEIESFVRLSAEEDFRVRYGGRELDIKEYFIVDTSFFNIFTYQFISGNPQTALSQPNSIVLTEETAQRIFDDEDAYGKYIAYADSFEVMVTGVIRNVPKNSHFTFDAIRPVTLFRHYYNMNEDPWRHNYFAQLYSYLLVRENAGIPTLEAKIGESVHNHFSQVYAERGTRREYPLQRLKDIHLRSTLGSEASVPGDIRYVYLFSMIAFFILCIASINFVNLSTARSAIRAKEVGLRKVFGGVKRELMKQFLGESLIITFISMVLCVVFVLVSLPVFNQLTGKIFTPDDVINVTSLTGLFIIFIATGLLAGSFPAFALTAFDPVRVLKGNLGSRTGKNVLRKVMVLIQFTISTFMIISVIVILKQMDYIINKDLGYDTDRIMILSSRGHGENILRDPIRQIPGVESVSFSFGIPGIQPGSDVFSLEGGAQDETHRTEVYHGDYDFINTYGLEIIRGRDFSREYSTDNTKIIINEKAVPLFGNMEDIIGKTLINVSRNNSAWEIIGVVKDFHYVNLKTEIHPLVMHLNNEWYQSISVRVRREDLSNTISSLRTAFSETVQNQEFDYYLLEDDLRNKYPEEDKVREVFIYFGILAILIAALGLFGLASISIQQRTKEIGIRKVLGASIGKVSGSLIKEFSIWILGANLIAWPIGYFFMDRWLQNFAYRIDFSMWFFILSGIVTFVIAVFTVSYQSIKVAKANPVDSLRYE